MTKLEFYHYQDNFIRFAPGVFTSDTVTVQLKRNVTLACIIASSRRMHSVE